MPSASTSTVTFGQTGDIPAPGNYDGLGYDEIAVYRPSTGQFLVLEPNGTTETLDLGVGNSADLSSLVPVPGAYDNLAYFTNSQAAADRSGCVRSHHRRVYDSRAWSALPTQCPDSFLETFPPPLTIWGTGQPSPSCSDLILGSSSEQGGRHRDVWPVG